jgi:hypothetical protein
MGNMLVLVNVVVLDAIPCTIKYNIVFFDNLSILLANRWLTILVFVSGIILLNHVIYLCHSFFVFKRIVNTLLNCIIVHFNTV